MFKESDVNESDKNFLTIEHVPPQYLGGKVEVLTCFKCNNLFSEFDNELNFVPHKLHSKVVNWKAKLKSDEDKFGATTLLSDFVRQKTADIALGFLLVTSADIPCEATS